MVYVITRWSVTLDRIDNRLIAYSWPVCKPQTASQAQLKSKPKQMLAQSQPNECGTTDTSSRRAEAYNRPLGQNESSHETHPFRLQQLLQRVLRLTFVAFNYADAVRGEEQVLGVSKPTRASPARHTKVTAECSGRGGNVPSNLIIQALPDEICPAD